ncbi:MAG TPA: hypothetical protein VK762_22530 [Polyangiaceae bacterium]|nr:hypothetical protein [Polyangiaceae bacterium]
MAADFCVAPGNGNSLDLGDNDIFTYGLSWGDDAPWSDDAIFRIVSDDESQTHDFHKGDGEAQGDVVVFTFTESKPDVLYRGRVIDGEITFEIFDAVELWKLQDPTDPCAVLPLPDDSDDPAGSGDPDDSSDSSDSDDSGDSDPDPSSDSSDGSDDSSSDP